MLKSKLKFTAKRQKVSAFSLQPLALACSAFTLIEIMVVTVLMSLIVVALMAVFNATQTAFRASLTQTDVLEGGRATMGLIKSDLESMTPSLGQSNIVLNAGNFSFIPSIAPVNFFVTNNTYQYQSGFAPLIQSLAGVTSPTTQRTNVLQRFFILTRQNTTWTGVGYVVDTTSTNYFNPLYRFSITTNVMVRNMPWALYTNFLYTPFTNMSHLVDGVVHLTVRAYDINGQWMTNGYPFGYTNIARNVWFSGSAWGETGFYMFSNTLPASVEIGLGILEDRSIQRAESLINVSPVACSNYLAGRAGQVHLFRQRIPIRNFDLSAYQ